MSFGRQMRGQTATLLVGALILGACTADSEVRAVQVDDREFATEQSVRGPSADRDFARSLSSAFRDAAENTLPATVFVSVERESGTVAAAPVPDLFRRFFEMPAPNRELPPQVGSGSGFVIDDDGHILTNHHVVTDAVRVEVRTQDGREFAAEVVGSDPATDVALLRVAHHGGSLVAAPLGSSDDVLVGDWVLALGNPLGLEFTVTSGIVSAKGRQLTGRSLAVESFIQTDAAINPGNSGGPLIDLTGQVVGINTAIFGSNRFVGYGFAVPIELALDVVDDLLEYGYARRPRLGARVSDVTAVDAEVYGLDRVRGAEVNALEDDAPAKGRLEVGDVILELDDESIEDANELIAALARRDPGERVKLTVLRDGREREVRVTLGEFESAEQGARPTGRDADVEELLGFRAAPVTPQLAERFGLERDAEFVITAVRPFGSAARAGVRAGQVLLAVNGENIDRAAEIEDLTAELEEGDVVSLRVADQELGETIINYRIRGR